MKHALFSMMVVAGLVTAGTAHGQPNLNLKTQIPFDFTVGQAKASAGEYYLSAEAGKPTISLSGSTGKIYAMTAVHSQAGSQNVAKLVFNCYGGRYFLAEVWGVAGKRALHKSATEKELARNAVNAERLELTAVAR